MPRKRKPRPEWLDDRACETCGDRSCGVMHARYSCVTNGMADWEPREPESSTEEELNADE